MRVMYVLNERDWIAFNASTLSSALVIGPVLVVTTGTVTVESHGSTFSEGNIRRKTIDAFLQFKQMTDHRSGGGRHAHM